MRNFRPTIIKRTKAILFDFDDTLAQTSKVAYKAQQELGRVYGLQITDEKIRKHWGEPYDDFFKSVFGDVDSVENLKQKYRKIRENHQNIPYEDALNFVNRVNEDYYLGVVSSAGTDIVEYDLRTTGYDTEWFFDIQGSDKTDAHKPDPDVFKPILSKLGVAGIEPSEVLYIGDALSDYYAAVGAGIRFVGLYERTTSKQLFDAEGATCVTSFDTLGDLID